MFDEYMEPHHVERPVSPAPAVSVPVNSAVYLPSGKTILLCCSSVDMIFVNVFAPKPSSEASSSEDLTMQDEIHEFDRLQVWELVPQPDCVMIIALKWIYKVKLDEYGDVLKNKASIEAIESLSQLPPVKNGPSVKWIFKTTFLNGSLKQVLGVVDTVHDFLWTKLFQGAVRSTLFIRKQAKYSSCSIYVDDIILARRP
ncbi:hypothetical protein Tco_0876892 [Tanacetum coccineum]|uniref:Reverse transcriptase Ty1/copia-type domain-containing protein n=1 Tax=Tanacetum coccineum TaxID=301880 RepID=A0ABQ5BTJ7_9ASTR